MLWPDAGLPSMRCTMCEYLVESMDVFIHLEMAINSSISSGWRLGAGGQRNVNIVPSWESETGFIEIAERACSEQELGAHGLRPLRPNMGEAQWQLVSNKSMTFRDQGSQWKGYRLLQHPTNAATGGENVEAAFDQMRDYAEACRGVISEFDEQLREVMLSPERTHSKSGWSTQPTLARLKIQMCDAKIKLCPSIRKWMSGTYTEEMLRRTRDSFMEHGEDAWAMLRDVDPRTKIRSDLTNTQPEFMREL